MKYSFDWTGVSSEDLINYSEDQEENIVFGIVQFEAGNNKYIIDLRHEYYSKSDRGFSADVYESCDKWYHIGWLFSVKQLMKDVKTEKSYKRFCRKTENAILAQLSA